ncbi:MAG: MarR family transcriptional regulator [Isosphaeraceae bacterium]|nr:MarR family transcriptional regulator [Isosphaeraceae bacterium]
MNRTSGLEEHAGYWLRYVSNHVSHAFAMKVAERGVTVAEWVLMRKMYETTNANPSRLAESVGLTRGAVSKLIDRLCRKQLAARSTSSDDRRFQTIELTEAGRRLVPVLAALADENDREFFGHLQPEERSGLVTLLRAIVRRHGWKDLPVD